MSTRHHGAAFDLERLIHTHLFVISPNNSGSTFLANALATSRATWNLDVEGQHVLGFRGPSTRSTGARLIWAAPHWIDRFADPAAYDWDVNRRAWYFQAHAHDPGAGVLVVKSPPFLLSVSALARRFANARFLFMLRNPYAMAEGILRRGREQTIPAGTDLRDAVARHVVACFRRQRENIDRHAGQGAFFTYEQMCAAPETVAAAIRVVVPEMVDLSLRQCLAVKGMYQQQLADMNAMQIARLGRDDIDALNLVFAGEGENFDEFGYKLL